MSRNSCWFERIELKTTHELQQTADKVFKDNGFKYSRVPGNIFCEVDTLPFLNQFYRPILLHLLHHYTTPHHHNSPDPNHPSTGRHQQASSWQALWDVS